MTFGTIRTLLRRLLQEQVADEWDDSTLNVFINLSYALIQKQVRKVDPEALIFWDYRNSIAGTIWYEKPAATRGPVEVGLKSSSAATDWTPLTRKPYYLARDWTGDPVYCHRGTYIGIFPAPTVSVTQGIQFVHAPTDTLAVDGDVPKLEQTLHYAIALWAALIAKGETLESDDKHAKELARLIGDIPSDYGSPDLGQPMQFDVDVSDTRGLGTGSVVSNGIYSR